MFYTENFCDENSHGGLEVATFRIAKALKESEKWDVFHAYRKNRLDGSQSIYSDLIKLPASSSAFEKTLKDFIKNNNIEVVVNMSRFYRHASIAKAAHLSGIQPKVIFMQHFAPGSENKKPTYRSGFHLLKLNPYNPLYWLRSSLYPLLKLPRRLSFAKVYRDTYQQSDRIILLSDGYKDDYCAIGKFSDKSKFVAIPNIFEDSLTEKDKDVITPLLKEKRVLILSRMDEIQKRISLALKIWAKIEEDTELGDWKLDIVGSGHNSDIVKRLIKKLKLQNVTFHGWRNRTPFLQRSSILISTSEYEGLPLSILEAQSFGVVPVAFNSYASVSDVIEPFGNGVLVEKFGDIDDFVRKLKDLMYDSSYREELSENAIKSISRFSQKKIGDQWLELLDSL